MKKKGKNLLIGLGIVFLFGVIGFLYSGGFLQSQFGENVYVAEWGNICCEEGAYEPTFTRYIDDYSLYKCNAYTDFCEIEVYPGEKLGLAARSFYTQICDIDGNNCGDKDYHRAGSYSPSDEVTYSKTLSYGQSIKFSATEFPNGDDWRYFKFDAKYRKFYIQGVERGEVFVEKSCILNSKLKQRVLSDGLNELAKTGPDRCQNYIIGYTDSFVNTYQYNGEEVVCSAGSLYKIRDLDMLQGSVRIQGDKINADIECCPTQPNCGSDFTFKDNVIKECDYDYQCANGGEPISSTGTSYFEWTCEQGSCQQSEEITVECTNNAVCVDKLNEPNAVCKDFECEIDDDWLGHCGDGTCESILGETPTSCPNDCGNYQNECTWWQIEKPAKTGLFGLTKSEPYCGTAGWVYALVGFFFLMILIIILMLIYVRRKK